MSHECDLEDNYALKVKDSIVNPRLFIEKYWTQGNLEDT